MAKKSVVITITPDADLLSALQGYSGGEPLDQTVTKLVRTGLSRILALQKYNTKQREVTKPAPQPKRGAK